MNGDANLQTVYMEGEISDFRLRPGGHQYFTLKDDHSKINAVMFKWQFQHVSFRPRNGMKVLVKGRVGSYPRFGEYQIYLSSMSETGIGKLYEEVQRIKNKLYNEGLFSPQLKKPLPRFPRRIAVITSPNGAVIRDIIVTARRRYPIVQIVLYPSAVQDEGSADDLTRQIKRVSADGNYDDLIIGRGGGSLEDLWGFESEKVARAIAACPIPVISSVGHETDTTICDLVADKRAATPTAAAELATPMPLTQVFDGLQECHDRIINAFKNKLDVLGNRLNKVQQSYVFKDPQRLYESYSQEVDYLHDHLLSVMRDDFSNANQRTQQATYQLRTMMIRFVNRYTQQIQQLTYRLNSLMTDRFNNHVQLTQQLNYRLNSLQSGFINRYVQRVQNLTYRLNNASPQTTIQRYDQWTQMKKQSLVNAMKSIVQSKLFSAQKLVGALNQLSPLNIMSHGYSLVSKNGQVVRHVQDLKPNDVVNLRVSDGQRKARILGDQGGQST